MIDSRVTLRPAGAGDMEFLWGLHQATMHEYVDRTWGWDAEDQRRRFVEGFDPGTLQVVERDGRAIGRLSVQHRPGEIFLASIEIAPELQNRGIATELIGEMCAEADRKRVPVGLSVLKVNPARRLYERLGFVCVEETATHYVMRREPPRSPFPPEHGP